MHGSAEIVDPLDDSHAGNGTPELQRDVDAERNRSLIAELRGRGVSVESSSRGVVVTIPDAFFGLDGDVLTQDAVFIVADLAGVLRSSAANGRRIAVEGHTDSVGSEEVNRSRSHRRARTVADALVSRGIARDILFVRGLGETLPVEPNVYPDGFDNPRGRARNRRVEIVVLNPQQR
ncbi:MAG TPA: OmpA family protein [Candidatus Binatia bacterium]|nr:OmpA family protein [Candidatus Binatia bacterium]